MLILVSFLVFLILYKGDTENLGEAFAGAMCGAFVEAVVEIIVFLLIRHFS